MYLKDHLARRVPNADKLDIATEKRVPATLLPLDYEPRVLLSGRRGDRLGDGLEGGDELDVAGGLVLSEEADVTVGFERGSRSEGHAWQRDANEEDEPEPVSKSALSSSLTNRSVVMGTPAGLPFAKRLIRRFFSHS